MGYPSYTHHFITSYELNLTTNESYLQRVALYEQCLDTWNTYMQADPQMQIRYAAKYASLSNTCKRLKGVISGIKQTGGIAKLQEEEDVFMQRVESSYAWREQYRNLMNDFNAHYIKLSKYITLYEVLHGGIQFIELVGFADKINKYLNDISEQTTNDEIEAFVEQQKEFYKQFNEKMDKELFIRLTKVVYQYVAPEFHPDFYHSQDDNIDSLAHILYDKSALRSPESLLHWIQSNKQQRVWENDPAIALIKSIFRSLDFDKLFQISRQIDSLYSLYTQAKPQVFLEKKKYPDANRTLRVSYGKIEGYIIDDTIYYNSYINVV
jgi:hypothetical protein